ncbi:MAG: phage holin family protein [Clostridia bacterium]|nr:phage holin family protein [Clostridia bacterium]
MNLLNYITDKALLLLPALSVLGYMLKNSQKVADKWIPLLLLPCGIAGALALCGVSVDAVLQGILLTGAAVYGHQIYKQIGKEE